MTSNECGICNPAERVLDSSGEDIRLGMMLLIPDCLLDYEAHYTSNLSEV
jgi:hypothetical protein